MKVEENNQHIQALSLMYACMHTHMHKEDRGRRDKYIKKNTETKHIYYMIILI